MDQFWLPAASLNNFIKIIIGLNNELLDALLICKDTIFLLKFEYTKVWFSWHEETSILNYINEAEA